jgi:peptide/nickel transport system permease protein
LTGYLPRRFLVALISLFGITLITFAIVHQTPGEPSLGSDPSARPADPATLAALRERYGLDRPLPAQYLSWAGRVVRLDFGRSLVDHRPVREKILERLPRTLALNGAALGILLLVAVPLGAWTAARGEGGVDLALPALSLLHAVPSFWVAILLQGALAVGLGLFPLAGTASEGAAGLPMYRRWTDAGWHLVLPAVSLAHGSLAYFTRFTRANLRAAFIAHHVRAARARGLPESRLLWRHAVAAAAIPFLTLAGLLLPSLVSGSVIIERIFAWPGLGSLLFDSLFTRDYPTILGLATLSALLVLAGTLAADLLYAVADPRLRRPAATGTRPRA